MLTVAVANTKGGTGKSTLACHLAAAFAHHGSTALLDLDRQGCASGFVHRRPRDLPRVRLVTELADLDTEYGVIDLPAGKRNLIDAVVPYVDVVIVPMMPSAFDEIGVALFLDRLNDHKDVRKGRRPVFVVANRVKSGTRTEGRLAQFLGTLHVSLVATVHDRQEFALAAATGITCYDGPPARGRACREDLAPLLDALGLAGLRDIGRYPNNNAKLVAK